MTAVEQSDDKGDGGEEAKGPRSPNDQGTTGTNRAASQIAAISYNDDRT